jgi:hypothetical protein
MTQITNTKVKVIPTEAQIDITIGGGLYARLSQLITDFGSQKPIEEFTAIMERLKTEKPQDAFEYHLITLLSLVIEIEEKATAQGKVVERDIKDLEAPKS